MRLLFFLQGKAVDDQIGFHEAFNTVLQEGDLSAYHAFPWRGYMLEHGWEALFSKILDEVKLFEPDVVYFQFFHYHNCPDVTDLFETIRKTNTRPIIVTSAGDAFSWNRFLERKYPLGFLSAARSSDVTFVTALGKCADYLVRSGIKNLALLPLGVCQNRFKPQALNSSEYKPEFDVVFIGGGNHRWISNPLNFLFYYRYKRSGMVKKLQKRYGKKFGLFGQGWDGNKSWQGPVSFAQQNDVCRRAQVVMGGCPGVYQDYYASDRPFIQGVSGIPMVDWRVPKIDKLLRDQDHWYLVNDDKSMLGQIDCLLETDIDVRLGKGLNTANYIHENLSQLAIMRFLIRTVTSVHKARKSGIIAPQPDFDFLLPEVDIHTEQQYLQRNWVG